MLSLRAFARAAPRAVSRVALPSARRSIVSTIHKSNAIRIQLPRTSVKAFSTSRPQFDAQAQELAAKLDQELLLENESSDDVATQSEENVRGFLDARDWEITDNEGEQFVKLSRNYEDEVIEVRFSIADFPPPYGEEDEIDDALLDEEDIEVQSGGANTKGAVNQGRTSAGNIKVAPEDSVAPADREELRDSEDESSSGQQPFAANVTVTVQRSGKQGALRVDLVAEDGDFSVQSITHLANAESANLNPTILIGSEQHYTGPPFPQLDEELQNIFESYLTERGIDSALALFVPEYIDVKEQREYLAWLRRVKEFVE